LHAFLQTLDLPNDAIRAIYSENARQLIRT
jgi:hypothetical protein